MTNKPMLSIERELRRAVEQAILAIKRIYQAGYDGIVSAGGSCDQPGVMFENDPTVRELRALLDKPADMPDRYADRDYCVALEQERDYLREQLNKPAAQHQGEPVAWRSLNSDGEIVTEWIDGIPPNRMADLSGNAARFDKLERAYAEHPAPVEVVMPERADSVAAERGYHKDWNAAIAEVTRLNGVTK